MASLTHWGRVWPLEGGLGGCHEGQMMLCTNTNITGSSRNFRLSVSK